MLRPLLSRHLVFCSVDIMKTKRFKTSLTAVLLALGLSSAAPILSAEGGVAEAPQTAEPREYALERHTLHMGTLINAKLFGATPEAVKHYAIVFEDKVTDYDDLMSVHKDTPLNEVNRRAGEPVEVPCEIADMTKQALAIADETNGAFEPMIGPVVNLWKIGFGGEHVPSDEAIAEAVSKVDRSKVRVWREGGRCMMQIAKGQSIDMGAIAKGFIGQRLSDILKHEGMTRGVLDLGGNIVAVGEKSDGRPWRIGIQHPAESRGGYFAVASVKDESVITSGAYERYFEENGKRYSHILDPKTGRPAKTDISSVTIIDRDGARADALCTALFAMGWDRAEAFLRTLIIFYIKLHLMSYNLVFIIALIIWTFFILRCKKPCIIILVHIYITHELLRFFIIYHIIAIITIIMSYRHCYLFPVCSILHSYFQACNHPNQGIHT